MLVAEGAGMTSGNDDLEQELRRNLKLRRELGAQAAKGKAALSAKQDGGFAYRLGWVLYWVCLALSLGWAAIGLYAGVQRPSNFSNVIYYAYFVLPAAVAYALGRAFRYVLAGD